MGRTAGSPNLRDVEIDAIIRGIKSRLPSVKEGKYGMMHCYRLVAEKTGFDEKTVARVWRMMQPTTGLATDFLKARAFRLARKVVRDASVDQALDILSRPNIGVLDPIKKQEGGPGGFFISVTADSCGAVNVGIAGGSMPEFPALQPQLTEGEGAILEGEYEEEEPPAPPPPVKERGVGQNKGYLAAVEAARKRLEEKKARAAKRLDKKARQGHK